MAYEIVSQAIWPEGSYFETPTLRQCLKWDILCLVLQSLQKCVYRNNIEHLTKRETAIYCSVPILPTWGHEKDPSSRLVGLLAQNIPGLTSHECSSHIVEYVQLMM